MNDLTPESPVDRRSRTIRPDKDTAVLFATSLTRGRDGGLTETALVQLSRKSSIVGRESSSAVVIGADHHLYTRACAVTDPHLTATGLRIAVAAVYADLEAWHSEYCGPEILRALKAFVESPPAAGGGG